MKLFYATIQRPRSVLKARSLRSTGACYVVMRQQRPYNKGTSVAMYGVHRQVLTFASCGARRWITRQGKMHGGLTLYAQLFRSLFSVL